MQKSTMGLSILGGILAVASTAFLVLWDKARVEGSIYTCPYCKARFVMDYKEYMKHPHMGTKVKVTCPRCERYCYCKSETEPLDRIVKYKSLISGVTPY